MVGRHVSVWGADCFLHELWVCLILAQVLLRSSMCVFKPHDPQMFVFPPLQGAVSGSVQATDRLMKELRDIYRSQSFKGGEFASGRA